MFLGLLFHKLANWGANTEPIWVQYQFMNYQCGCWIILMWWIQIHKELLKATWLNETYWSHESNIKQLIQLYFINFQTVLNICVYALDTCSQILIIMSQSNNAYYIRIDMKMVSQKISCVYTRDLLCIKESLVYTQEISCTCTTLLCMLWATEPRSQEPTKAAGPVRPPPPTPHPRTKPGRHGRKPIRYSFSFTCRGEFVFVFF